MALGGGTFTTQNKVLPGAYINVVSAARASATLGERGVVALPLALSWGNGGEVITVTATEFVTDSMKLFGYPYTDAKMQPLREVFKKAQKAHIYNLCNGAKATCSKYATAKKSGVRGNDLKLVIQQNINSTSLYDVTLYLGTSAVFSQTAASTAELKENAYVTWTTTDTLAVTAGLSFSGGTDGTVDTTAYQNALNKLESYNFNSLACPDKSVAELYVEFTKRMRDNVGVKFQTVVPKVLNSDYEGIVQLTEEQAAALYWTVGAIAGCAINKSNTNMLYDGELEIPCNETQTELEQSVKDGVFMFHKVEDETRVLLDINSFVSFTDEKGELFSNNQTIRVIDQCACDDARTFNTKYLGKVQNDASGRVSFWGDIVTHRKQLETKRAIENYNSDDLVVALGETKGAVTVRDAITITGTMEKLYMESVIS